MSDRPDDFTVRHDPSVLEEPDLRRAPRLQVGYARIDRLPPNSPEAEMGVLGCAMLSPQENLGICAEKLPSSEAFYDLRHRTLYEVLMAMHGEQQPIDLVTLGQRLKDAQQLEGLGGLTFLSSLLDAVPNASNLLYYLEIVREKAVLRGLVSTCTGVVTRVYEHEGDVTKLLDEVERDILAIRDGATQDKAERTPKERARSAADRVQERFEKRVGLETGFHDLDALLGGGLRAGQLLVIAARPNVGKSCWVTQMAVQIALQTESHVGLPVGYISLEMSEEELDDRILSHLARFSVMGITPDNRPTEAEFRKLTAAAARMTKLPVWIDDQPGRTIAQIKARGRRWQRRHGIQLLIVDYLQLISSQNRKQNRESEVAEIARGLKDLAKELKIPVCAVAQLNREMEKGNARKPKMSDIRESGEIEAAADIICALYEPEEDEDARPVSSPDMQHWKPVNLQLLKQRQGPKNVTLQFMFNGGVSMFETRSRMQEPNT